MNYKVIIYFIVFLTLSCKKEVHKPAHKAGLDVILVIGQSNTHQGWGYDSILDMPNPRIKQLGRFAANNYKIILATEPLDHFSKLNGHIGFPMTFAKKYLNEFISADRNVLIIPASMGSTGFAGNFWNVGDTLYNDAVERTNYILQNYDSKLVAILWHQGESDVGYPPYQQKLDTMIAQMRKDIIGDNTNVPFILGGMVPYWVDQDSTRIIYNQIISGTINRVSKTGYADPRNPFVIVKPDNTVVSVHYDANGQREMGNRYFEEYKKLK